MHLVKAVLFFAAVVAAGETCTSSWDPTVTVTPVTFTTVSATPPAMSTTTITSGIETTTTGVVVPPPGGSVTESGSSGRYVPEFSNSLTVVFLQVFLRPFPQSFHLLSHRSRPQLLAH